jgi:hypothetical protein
MFVWDRVSIYKAKILADLGFSSSETAQVIGANRNSCISRSRRLGEFRFKAKSGGFLHRPEYIRKRVAEAEKASAYVTEEYLDSIGVLALVEQTPKTSKFPANPSGDIPKMSAIVKDRRKSAKIQRHRGVIPTFHKTAVNPDIPITPKALSQLLAPSPVTTSSIKLLDAGPRSCRWIVGEVDGLETRVCGNKTFQPGESYCEHHGRLSRNNWKPQVKKGKSSDQNTKPVEAMKKDNTSVP